jgi:hypothetical protein
MITTILKKRNMLDDVNHEINEITKASRSETMDVDEGNIE